MLISIHLLTFLWVNYNLRKLKVLLFVCALYCINYIVFISMITFPTALPPLRYCMAFIVSDTGKC